MHEKTPKSYEVNSDYGCSLSRKEKYKKVSQPLVISGKKVIVSFLKINVNRDVAISV